MVAFTERRCWTVFSFVADSLDLGAVTALVRETDLGFTPAMARVRVLGEPDAEMPFGDDVWDRVMSTEGAYGFVLSGPGGADPSFDAAVLSLSTEVMLSEAWPTPSLLESLVTAPGLIGGARGDATDAHWQGEDQVNQYRMWFDGPWEHLPRTIDSWGDEVIDVSGNPGRITQVPGLRLWAAQDVWFGPEAAGRPARTRRRPTCR